MYELTVLMYSPIVYLGLLSGLSVVNNVLGTPAGCFSEVITVKIA